MSKNIILICGGMSKEHEVSVQSANNIFKSLIEAKFFVYLVYVSKEGLWFQIEEPLRFFDSASFQKVTLPSRVKRVAVVPGGGENSFIDLESNKALAKIDAVFPIIHGPRGEDGTLQGLLETCNIAYVGPGVLGSSIGMDKDLFKQVLSYNNIKVARWIAIESFDYESLKLKLKDFSLPYFVKPANMGSSVGVTKVESMDSLADAIFEAFKFDTKVLIEEGVVGREIECAVIGNSKPRASEIGEIIPENKIYSYEGKYLSSDSAKLEIPARISERDKKNARDIAVRCFKAIGAFGLSRVDMFLKDNGEIVVNEINTLPGFTSISMYPKLFEAVGVGYPELVSELIDLAIERLNLSKEKLV